MCALMRCKGGVAKGYEKSASAAIRALALTAADATQAPKGRLQEQFSSRSKVYTFVLLLNLAQQL